MTNVQINHIILHEDEEINIGESLLNPRIIGMCRYDITDEKTDDMFTIKRIVNYPVPGDSYIHLIQIFNHTDYELHFYAVNHLPYHENGKYLHNIYYDINCKLKANTLYDALMEFAEFAEMYNG